MATSSLDRKYNQPTAAPTTKVAASALGGAVSIVLIYAAGLAGLDLPAEVASSVTLIVMFALGYFVKDRG